ncbi:hypothetical protein LIER_24398 [Lithospermum erythrorhizon]|uniref:Uncharacterized protein n=1 Tax=Lithospermum erythrorhizon TaxID=34254 RepID=A0AAV3R361_LITER
MAYVPSYPEYTPSVRYAVAVDPRWIALCGSHRGNPLSYPIVMDEIERRYLDRRGVPQGERAAAALDVTLGSGLVHTLEDRQQLLDYDVTVLNGHSKMHRRWAFITRICRHL